jgi:hypothetical protein
MVQTQTSPSDKKTVNIKPKAYFFVSNLGQVGKSTNCKMLIHYLREQQQDPIILDMDTFNPNVAKSYIPDIVNSWSNPNLPGTASSGVARFRRQAPSKKVSQGTNQDKVTDILANQFTFDTTDLDIKFLELIELGRDIIVNISGNNYLPLCNFLNSIEAHKSNAFDLYICWVTNGATECLELFTKTQQRFEGAKFLLIFNEGNNLAVRDWDNYFLTPEILQLDREEKIKLASLPFVSVDDYWHRGQNLPYSKWVSDPSLSAHRRRAIQVWVDMAIRSIEESGIFA